MISPGEDLPARFAAELAALALPPGPALVAVSGGGDSVALLDLLVAVGEAERRELVVVHADHGIHPASAGIAESVRRLAEGYGLRAIVERLRLSADATETAARAARHGWLDRVRREVGARFVFLAHHADDQAETVLMRVLEGSGPAGLSAMRAVRGALVRPLLPFRRELLARYALDRGLPVWDDPANRDPRHFRSWIRTVLLPLLREARPGVDGSLVRVAAEAAVERDAWDALLDALPELAVASDADGVSVAADPLARYDSPLALGLVRAVARRAGCHLGRVRAARLLALAAAGRSGAEIPLGERWRGELAFGRLRVLRRAAEAAAEPFELVGDTGEKRWGRWAIRWRRERAPARQARAGDAAWFRPATLVVRPWAEGDRLRPLGGRGGRLVVRCFQDAKVPRNDRARWPLIVDDGGRVVWVPGVCRSDLLVPDDGTEALRVDAAFA